MKREMVLAALVTAVSMTGFGRTAEPWKAERDVTKAKVYVAEDSTDAAYPSFADDRAAMILVK